MKKFIEEFKTFALRGNMMDMAVGILIGGAFSGIVTSLTDNFITPILKFITGAETYDLQDVAGFASSFVSALVNFFIMALVLFCLLKVINKLMKLGRKKEEAAAPVTKKCPYCMSATGMGGYRRNLTAYEMVGQILAAQKDENRRVSNVVLMGMGEPLDNYENVLSFLCMVSDPEGLNIGMRHISLSTCGVVDKIYDLMEHRFQLTLSVSLHAPNDEIRGKIMPINKKWGIDALLTACRDYTAATKRRISFEYAMIDGVNDSDACARQLAQRLRGMLCHVNLIPANDVNGKPFQKSGRERLLRFSEILTKKGITTTVRRSLGADIEAACGQLRGKHGAVTS